jgi:hypothetical protein
MKSYFILKVEDPENLQFIYSALDKTFKPGEANTVIVDTENKQIIIIPGRFGEDIVIKRLDELGYPYQKINSKAIAVSNDGNIELSSLRGKHIETASRKYVLDLSSWITQKLWENSVAKYPTLEIESEEKPLSKLVKQRRFIKASDTRNYKKTISGSVD